MKKVKKNIFSKLIFSLLKKIHNLYNDLPFLLQRMKIEKIEKLVTNLHDPKKYVIRKH